MQVIDLEISKAQGCCKPYFNIKVILLLLIKKKFSTKQSQLKICARQHNGKEGKKRELIPCDVQKPSYQDLVQLKKKEKEKKIAHNLH